MMKLLLPLPATSILLAVLCFAFIHSVVSAKTMYRWVDEHGKVSFSDQIPPAKAALKHDELDKDAQVIKVTERAKTKDEIEMEKRIESLRKQQELIIAKQKAQDKKLLSNFIDLDALNANYKIKMQALNGQDQELRDTIKKLEDELTNQQQDAADYEIKNKKIPFELLSKIKENQKNIVQAKQDAAQLQLKKAIAEKEFTNNKARFVSLTHSKTSYAAKAGSKTVVNQPGLFSCANVAQCDKAWPLAKEFVKTNTVAKISTDTDTLFMSEDPVTDSDLSLSISKTTIEKNNPQIFLDIHCTESATTKGLCVSYKANEIRTRFTDYLNEKLNVRTDPAPAK